MEFLKNLNLKPREDVIFENASEYEKNCNYSFKVKRDSVKEILSIIESLDPKELNENTYTIKRLNRSKAEQLDRLEYTYFRVYVFENKFIDREDLKDSWKTAIKSFVRDINKIAQDITINLAALLFLILEYIKFKNTKNISIHERCFFIMFA